MFLSNWGHVKLLWIFFLMWRLENNKPRPYFTKLVIMFPTLKTFLCCNFVTSHQELNPFSQILCIFYQWQASELVFWSLWAQALISLAVCLCLLEHLFLESSGLKPNLHRVRYSSMSQHDIQEPWLSCKLTASSNCQHTMIFKVQTHEQYYL